MKILKIVLLLFLSLYFSSSAFALSTQAYESDANLKEGVVVLDFHASWCSTCRAQSSAFKKLSNEESLEGVTVYKVDFDSQADLKKQYKVYKQSTLVVLKDGSEVARSTGTTSKNAIGALIKKAL